jgi:peptidoglycan hydrolase CwlO-like protein
MEFFTKNAGWLITMFLGAVSWFVYIVRQNDKLNALSDRVSSLEDDGKKANDTMAKTLFQQENQGEKIDKLETVSEKTTDILNELKSDIKLISAWVKSQSGDTLIVHRKEK